MNTKTIIITQEIEVPDYDSTIESGIYLIDDARRANEEIEKKIMQMAESRIKLMTEYFKSVLGDILKLDDKHIALIFPNNGYINRAKKDPNDISYHLTFSHFRQCTHKQSALKISLENASEVCMTVTVYRDGTVKEDHPNWVLNSHYFFAGWSVYKDILNTIINEMIDRALEKEKNKTKQSINLLNVLEDFCI